VGSDQGVGRLFLRLLDLQGSRRAPRRVLARRRRLAPAGRRDLLRRQGRSADQERIERTLDDGRRFTIIDRPRTRAELVAPFAAVGLEIEVETIGSRFCIGRGTKS